MKQSTIEQNRRACRKALLSYEAGNPSQAREQARRVSWAFFYNWLLRETHLNEGECLEITNTIKGKVAT